LELRRIRNGEKAVYCTQHEKGFVLNVDQLLSMINRQKEVAELLERGGGVDQKKNEKGEEKSSGVQVVGGGQPER